MVSVREFALGIVLGETLGAKLAPPPAELDLEDREPSLRIAAPGRPTELAIASARTVRTPPLAGMRDPLQRARILHALANHELQAIELFAWALLAYPNAPEAFRRGLVAILAEEQPYACLWTLTNYSAYHRKVRRVQIHPYKFFSFADEWFIPASEQK